MSAPPFTADEAGVSRALVALGESADEVADTLLRLGCRGERGECRTCPVAEYLHNVAFGGDFTQVVADVRVTDSDARIWFGAAILPLRVWMPVAVREFVARFDQSDRYVELVAP